MSYTIHVMIILQDSLKLNFRRVVLWSVWWLIGACGGRSVSDAPNANLGGANSGASGAAVTAAGGVVFTAVGGASVMAAGGTKVTAAGGAHVTATGGATISVAGTTGFVTTGGSWNSATGGATGLISCANVTCPAIPATCKLIIQDLNSCCPSCPDTGCTPCTNIVCPSGTHLETPVGACCPECVTDKLDACAQGQQDYAAIRTTLLNKYGSSGCRNSSDCVIVPENNLCVWSCGNPVPSTTANNLKMNLDSNAQSSCATCSTPVSVPCGTMVPACVNGKCVTASPL
jgi:hypothetical protein